MCGTPGGLFRSSSALRPCCCLTSVLYRIIQLLPFCSHINMKSNGMACEFLVFFSDMQSLFQCSLKIQVAGSPSLYCGGGPRRSVRFPGPVWGQPGVALTVALCGAPQHKEGSVFPQFLHGLRSLLGFCFVNCFIEISFTYYSIHPFKPLNGFRYIQSYTTITTIWFQSISSPQKENLCPLEVTPHFPSPPALLRLLSICID